MQAKFDLPAKIKAELTGWYTNGGQDGIITFEQMYGMNFGMQRKFMNDKLTVKTGINDFVNRFFTGDIDYNNTTANIASFWDNKIVP